MSMRILRLVKLSQKRDVRTIHTSSKLSEFWEPNRKSGFPTLHDYKDRNKPPEEFWENFRWKCNNVLNECKLLKDEIKVKLQHDPEISNNPDEVDIQWQFNGDPTSLDNWVLTVDSDYNIGKSAASLDMSPDGSGIFSGFIDTQPIKDGKLKYAGFANIKTIQPRKSFYRFKTHEWGFYTHLILRVRGDGRSYGLNLHPYSTFDIHWNDLHSYGLYTRGGPYWQYCKIPFSKFLLISRGRVQDTQYSVKKQLNNILSFSITAHGVPGPFRLEIDFVGLEQDEKYDEEFAYELYKPPQPYYS